MKKEVSKNIKLKNGQWLKVQFRHIKQINTWVIDICVSNSKRVNNDCIKKTCKSPKNIYGHHTGRNTGIEPFLISLRTLKEFEKTLKNTRIRMTSATTELEAIYNRLLTYGYKKETKIGSDGKNKTIFYKELK